MIRRSTPVAIAFPRGVRLGAGLLGLLLLAAAAIPSARAETVYSIRVRLNPNAVAAGALTASHQARLEALRRHEAHARSGTTRTGALELALAEPQDAADLKPKLAAMRDGPLGALGRDGGARAAARRRSAPRVHRQGTRPARTSTSATSSSCGSRATRRRTGPRCCPASTSGWAPSRFPNGRSATSGCCDSCRRCAPTPLRRWRRASRRIPPCSTPTRCAAGSRSWFRTTRSSRLSGR